MKEIPYITHSSEVVFSCPKWKVRKDAISLPNGEEGECFYVDRSPCVLVVPVTKEGEIVMIHNYRHILKQWCWEIPAGGIEDNESLEEAAHRELEEETGGKADQMEFISKFYLSNGTSNDEGHVFLATNVTIGQHKRETFEIMEMKTRSIDEALAMARNGEITDGASALALILCEEKLKSWSKILGNREKG